MTRWLFIASFILLAACGDPAPGEGVDAAAAPESMPQIMAASEAIASPDIPTIDLHSMADAEILKVIPTGARCDFSYSRAGRPVFSAAVGDDGAKGVIKIHGRLVELSAPPASFDALSKGATFKADALHVEVIPDADGEPERDAGKLQQEADAILQLDKGLHVGYRGWYRCSSPQQKADR